MLEFLKMLGIGIGWMSGVITTFVLTWIVAWDIMHWKVWPKSYEWPDRGFWWKFLEQFLTFGCFFIWPILFTFDVIVIIVHNAHNKIMNAYHNFFYRMY